MTYCKIVSKMNQVTCFSFCGKNSIKSMGRFRDHCHEMKIEALRQVRAAMEREMKVLKRKEHN